MRISRDFIIALKLDPRPAYQLCQLAGLEPTLLSKLIHGVISSKGHEDKIERIGQHLGLSTSECWVEDEQ